MKLWLISQDKNNGYDTFDSAVVAAESEDAARNTHPATWTADSSKYWECERAPGGYWTTPENVSVSYLGEAAEGTAASVICASFNAG